MNPIYTELLHRLLPRDLAILDALEAHRFLTTRHLQRLYFQVGNGHHATYAGATRAASRTLAKLRGHQLIKPLERRIGGVRKGSQGFVWQLTALGDRIQRSRRGQHGRKRYQEPSRQFLDHTLAITDIVVELRLLEQAGTLEVLDIVPEPVCWREFTGQHGIAISVKPDLYAVTATGPWEDYWFIEVDRSTEHVPTVIAKCHIYASFAASGIEQARLGVFPAVLWIVPDQARKATLLRAIRNDATLPDDLFRIVTTSEFAAHLTPNV